MSDFLDDYWTYHKCYEIPQSYAFMCGITLIGAVVNRKVHFFHGDIELHGNLYTLLVGPQGNSKSTCCDFARDCFMDTCPNMRLGSSTQSAEDIVKMMSEKDFSKVFTNERDEQVELNALAFFINEFKNFVAYNPARMLNFLTDIYDRKMFDSSTIKRGSEIIINPSLNILACENPDQLIGMMKNNIMSGGMARRMMVIYEPGMADARAIIKIPDEARAAWNRVKDRLRAAREFRAEFKWTESGQKFYVPWYEQKHRRMDSITNPMVRGFEGTKHIQLFKVAMLLDSVSDKPMGLFTDELLELALAHIEIGTKHMGKLSIAAGRNELAFAQQKMLETLSIQGGLMAEKALRRSIEAELTPFETNNIIGHLVDTDQVFRKTYDWEVEPGKKVPKVTIMLPETYYKLKEKGLIS
jgi:hypothetical protein